jgi:hypothetical protein
MWTTADVELALHRGVETREFEVKTACDAGEAVPMGRITRGVLAMSNIAYGGRIVVGIGDATIADMTPGLSEQQLAKWTDGKTAHDFIAKYADPPIDVIITKHELSNGKTIVLLDVPGIAGEAHFCIKELHDPATNKLVLRRHALYIRSQGKPESVEVSTRAQMTEIIESAATYRLRAFVEQADRAGVSLSASGNGPTPAEADAEYFDQQHRKAFG